MSEPSTKTEIFDVFLCHNSEDKPEIRNISLKLKEKGIKPWLDEEQVRPGTSWQSALGEQIKNIKSAAVFVGKSGLGPWQNQEIQALLSQFVNRKCSVIPVVLPSAKDMPKLPWTLENLQKVDFRVPKPDPLKQLIFGITGEKPKELPEGSSYSGSNIPQGPDLFPPKEKKVMELRLPVDLDEFTDEAKMVLLESLNNLMKIGPVQITTVVEGSVRIYLELDPEAADKIYSADKEGRLVDLGISEARLYPAIAEPPEGEQRAQLLILLDRVNEYWIEGVLKNSLYNEVLISLGKRAMDEAVEPPWKHFVELPRQRRHLILQNRSINNVFDATGLLLILGEPGSGKTTTLLDLAWELIPPAKKDPKERVPIVLNLSSWKKKQKLDEWIVKELSAKYRVPVKIGRFWLKNDYLLPMLDGLDEVHNDLRPDCVAEINYFIEHFEPSGLVVCCRLMEYQWLPDRLKLNGAICLESLGIDEVNEFLNSGGSQLVGLRHAIKVDPVLRELSQTPLMLSIMSLAFEDISGDDLDKQKAGSHKKTREQIFNLYVDRMLKRKKLKDNQFSKDKVISRLVYLAKRMKDHSQSVFMVEELQPSWLNTKGQWIAYGALTASIIACICGLGFGLISGLNSGTIVGLCIFLGIGLGCWPEHKLKVLIFNTFIGGLTGGVLDYGLNGVMSSWLSSWFGYYYFGFVPNWLVYVFVSKPISEPSGGLIFGLIVGIIGGFGIGSLKIIFPIEKLNWQWKQFLRKSVKGLIFGLIIGLLAGLIGLSGPWADRYRETVGRMSGQMIEWQYYWHTEGLSLRTILAMISGLSLRTVLAIIGGMIGGAVSGLLGGISDTLKADKSLPNQGIKLSHCCPGKFI